MHCLTTRKVRGLLAVGAVFAVVLLGAPGSADAESLPDPMASFCAPMTFAGWSADPLQLCRKALQQMRAGRKVGVVPTVHSPATTEHLVVRRRPVERRPVVRPRKAVAAHPGLAIGRLAPVAPPAVRAQGGATEEPNPSKPNLLIWLLLPLVGAIAFALHRMVLAPAGVTSGRTAVREFEPEPELVAAPIGFDPFVRPAVLGLRGPGAVDAARFMVLTVLETAAGGARFDDGVLVVMPRAEANLLFGIGDDEPIDEPGGPLFLPGTLDGALSYLETELAHRERHDRDALRLVLVTRPESSSPESSSPESSSPESSTPGSTARIRALVGRYPGDLSVIVAGDWPDGSVTVDENGAVSAGDAEAGFADALPGRLPALSRTECRDRLTALLRRHGARFSPLRR